MFPEMWSDSIVVCWKNPKWEIDLATSGMSEAEQRAYYRRLKRDPERAIASAERQNASRKLVESALGPSVFVPRGQLRRPMLESKRLLIMGGGDNHAIWGAHFAPLDSIDLILLNSDFSGIPDLGSYGGILYFTAEELVQCLEAIQHGDYEIEEWTLLEVRVGKNYRALAVSEVYIGERDSTDFSGNHIEFPGFSGRHAGSGTLIATGAGTSKGSWHHSASYNLGCPGPQSPTTRSMYMINREQNMGRDSEFSARCTEIKGAKRTVRITSMNDADGIVRVDSLKEFPFTIPFPQGETAAVRIAKERLRVVRNPLRPR